MNKRNSITKVIRDLGAGYRQILRDGWVHYLLQKDAAGEVGQGARLVETATAFLSGGVWYALTFKSVPPAHLKVLELTYCKYYRL